MKILCISDQIDPLIYNSNAKKNFPDIDLILCAGDLPMDYVDFVVSVFNKPAYFVFGNHDLSEYKYYSHRQQNFISEKDHGATYLGFKAETNKKLSFTDPLTNRKTPLLIAGADGSINYNGGLCQFSDTQMYFKLILMLPRLIYNKLRYGRFLDIFLTHSPSYKIHDAPDPCHTGFKSFNWFIKTFKPSLMVHGHVHLYDQRDERQGLYWETNIINAFAHTLIEFPDAKTEK